MAAALDPQTALAEAASAGIHCMPIPTPFLVGRVNCYLIEDDPLTLVDTGPNSGTAFVTLERKLAEHGRRLEDLERVVDDRWDPPVTLGVRLVSVLSDDLQHVGQAAYVRGLMLGF